MYNTYVVYTVPVQKSDKMHKANTVVGHVRNKQVLYSYRSYLTSHIEEAVDFWREARLYYIAVHL